MKIYIFGLTFVLLLCCLTASGSAQSSTSKDTTGAGATGKPPSGALGAPPMGALGKPPVGALGKPPIDALGKPPMGAAGTLRPRFIERPPAGTQRQAPRRPAEPDSPEYIEDTVDDRIDQ